MQLFQNIKTLSNEQNFVKSCHRSFEQSLFLLDYVSCLIPCDRSSSTYLGRCRKRSLKVKSLPGSRITSMSAHYNEISTKIFFLFAFKFEFEFHLAVQRYPCPERPVLCGPHVLELVVAKATEVEAKGPVRGDGVTPNRSSVLEKYYF